MKCRTVALVIISILLLAGCASTPTSDGNPIHIQRVIKAQGTQDDLYRRANEWMAKTFVASSEVIQYQDKAEGIIVGRGIHKKKMGLGIVVDFWYTMTIETKENRCRTTIEDVFGEITIEGRKDHVPDEELDNKTKAELTAYFESLINDLASALDQIPDEW